VCGVSTRRVDQLVESRTRPFEGRYPYLFVDAKVEKVRDGGRAARKAVVVAHAVHESGRREIIGLDIGAAETEAFWTEFLRSLVARGLVGVELAISDAHEGLKTRWPRSWAHRGSAAPCTSCATSGAMSTKISTTLWEL
jgi:putative transposase